ncbi:MAG: ParE toxin of type toxin-antitoxin system, parDE [Verrucomicrobiota bacterium]|jgi:plasmid stabilization system protein ParE
MKVVISRRAEEDLARIYASIAARHPGAAERFRIEAEKALASLGRNAELGPRPGWKTRHTRLRFWVISRFHNYLIYYEPGQDAVSIERVLDGRRDVTRIVEEGVEHPLPED